MSERESFVRLRNYAGSRNLGAMEGSWNLLIA